MELATLIFRAIGTILALGMMQLTAVAERPNILVVFVDDMGYADLGANGVRDDVKTPHLDRLARMGARFTNGYITAPQCSPSRAGLLAGRYQQRFGLEHIPDLPLPLEETLLSERLKEAGYETGIVGKWHLSPSFLSDEWIRAHNVESDGTHEGFKPSPELMAKYRPAARGFDLYFAGERNHYDANFDLSGNGISPGQSWRSFEGYRLDIQADAAIAFLKRKREKPFFLYYCPYAPHTPLVAPDKYLSRFPDVEPERRRYALAMISAVDDSVGRILDTLEANGWLENTLTFFASDNGAPVWGRRNADRPEGDPGGWDGSLNEPFKGEKGMVAEGGVRVPFLMAWPGIVPAGVVYEQPVSSLDIAATSVAVAGAPSDASLEGANLVPYLRGEETGAPHDALYWRFWSQAAVRQGPWKYLEVGRKGRFLFKMDAVEAPQTNRIADHPEMAKRMAKKLQAWTQELDPPGRPQQMNKQEKVWYQDHFNYGE